MKKVFVNGYGSIGSRIAKFIKEDPEIQVLGIGKYSPDEKVQHALDNGFSVYVPEKKINDFTDDIKGSIESILDDCDLVIDASPGGYGYLNKKNIYEPKGISAVFQGGETIFGENAVSDILFNSRVNYADAFGKKYVMQGSCNVTGMGRILNPLREKYADRLYLLERLKFQLDKCICILWTFVSRIMHQLLMKFMICLRMNMALQFFILLKVQKMFVNLLNLLNSILRIQIWYIFTLT